MFVMNAPPVVALQASWEAFSPPGSFRFPGCFSGSAEDVTRAAVSAQVQMIISSLQRDEAALGMSNERTAQRSQRAARCRQEARPAAGPAPCREQPACAACGPAAPGEPPAEEEASGCGPLGQESDSDDSVDRDIEEAIQEYLKARSGAAQPGPVGARLGRVSGAGGRGNPEPLRGSTTPAPCPPKPGPVPVPAGTSQDQGSASPVSVSSEDSFEQSIRAEIEQFLHEKKQHENPKCERSGDKTPDPHENPARSTQKAREPPGRAAPRQDPRVTCRDFVFHKRPRLARGPTQPRSLRPKVTSEPETAGITRPAAPRPEAAQNKGGARRGPGTGRRGRQARSPTPVHEASDSSSDDGIEEAIQLYQLEKTRKEAAGGGDPSPRALPREEAGPEPPAGGASGSTKSALPEPHRRVPGKKPVAPKATDPSPGVLDADHPSRLLKDMKAPAPPGNPVARTEFVDRASCRADTSAELMCAEAILDISKAILPAPAEGSDRPPASSPLVCPPNVPSRSDGDSSSVDSDDSIEQEIRTFLALKAQSGGALARAESHPQPTRDTLSAPGPDSQAGDPKAPLCKASDLSPSCRRKRRGGSSAVRPSTPKKTKGVREGTQAGSHSQGRAQLCRDGRDSRSQGEASEAPEGEGETGGPPVYCRTARHGDGHLSQGPGGPGKAEAGRSVGEKESSEDKSSSLDSDADLDTAIKDLLRSKRKLKKRAKDPRAVARKVRFSTTETRCVDRPAGLPGGWRDRGPRVLRSCLAKSRGDSRTGPGARPPDIFSSMAERTKVGDMDVAPAFGSKRRPPEGTLFPRETATPDRVCPARSPSSPSEDSSVDSDDSIEMEIQKFLAEKAKESVSISEIQGAGSTALGPGGPARPEVLCRRDLVPALQPGVCTRSQRARGTPQLVEGPRGTERAGGQGAAGLFAQGGKSTPRPEHAARLPAVGRCEPALPRSTGGNASSRGSPASRRNACVLRDQSPRGAKPAAAEGAFGQLPGCARAGTEAGCTGGTFHANCGSRSLLTPSPGPQADLSLPWSDLTHQSRLPSPWALNLEGRGSAWTGVLGAEKDKVVEGQAKGPPSLTSEPRKGLPCTAFSPLLSTQLFHFGKSVPWGGAQAGLFSPHLGLPLQGPSFSAFRETQAGHSPVFGSPHLAKKDCGHWPTRRAQAGLGVHDRRNSGSEGVLDLRYRRRVISRDEQDQEALGSDASEFSDTSVEDGSPVVKGKALQL
ncbi:protein phosphatase 1 regulatory subunit 26 [Ctenodactylus gundi]